MPASATTSHAGLVYSTRNGGGWVAKPAPRSTMPTTRTIRLPYSGRLLKVVDEPVAPSKPRKGNSLLETPRIPSHQLDWSVSGLGAYRTYKRWPGQSFPCKAVTMNDNVPKSERQ